MEIPTLGCQGQWTVLRILSPLAHSVSECAVIQVRTLTYCTWIRFVHSEHDSCSNIGVRRDQSLNHHSG